MTATTISKPAMIMKLRSDGRDLLNGSAMQWIHGGAVYTDSAGQQWTTGTPGDNGSVMPRAPERRSDESQTEYAQRVAAMLPPVTKRDLGDQVADILEARRGQHTTR